MKRLLAFSAAMVLCGSVVFAADEAVSTAKALKVSKYQVTGPVVEVTDTKIVIAKDDGKWEIAREAATKASGDVKVGDKVTVEYKMLAVEITVKPAKPAAEKPEAEAPKAAK